MIFPNPESNFHSASGNHPVRQTHKYAMLPEKIGCSTLNKGTYKASPGANVEPVSGKLIRSDELEAFMSAEGNARYLLEAEPHQNVARVLSAQEPGEDGNPGFVVFQHFHGDLHSFVKSKKRLSEDLAKRLFAQITSAVAHCHGLGIMLRDLKLGKIMFANQEMTSVSIADLDGCRVVPFGRVPILSDAKGSPAYVAPEVLNFKPYEGTAADMWGLGVILYVMLTGKYPFQDSVPMKLLRKIKEARFHVPSHLSESSKRLLRRLLSRNPLERPTAAESLKDVWLRPDVAATAATEQRIGRSVAVGDANDREQMPIGRQGVKRGRSRNGAGVDENEEDKHLVCAAVKNSSLVSVDSVVRDDGDDDDDNDQVVPDVSAYVSVPSHVAKRCCVCVSN